MYFVGFYFVPNLIVILFNLLYLVSVVGIYCKGCVIVRESVKTQAIEASKVFAGILWLSIPRKDAYVLHMTGMQGFVQMEIIVSREYLAGKAFQQDTRKTFCSASLSCLIHTFCTLIIYTHITHKCEGGHSERKTLDRFSTTHTHPSF